MSSTTLTIDQLRLSPFNVRTNEEDANATAAMERSLLERGQMMPLLVHPMRGQKNLWGAFAGGRRYRSFKRLIESGRLPADHRIDVIIRDESDAELTELSLAENMVRRDLRPYEVFAAVVKAHKRGAAIEDIAETIGQPVLWIRQSIRLGTLARPIFNALERGAISVDQASAFAATEHHAVQLAAWDTLRGSGDTIGAVKPAQIRTAIGVDDLEAAKLLRMVGQQAYLDAGGMLEPDLFSEGSEQRVRISDVPLLRKLAEERYAEIRDAARERTARPDLRFVARIPQTDYNTPDFTLRVNAAAGADGAIELPVGDIVGLIEHCDAGPVVTYWWSSKKAKFGSASPARAARPRPAAGSGSAIGGHDSYAARPIADAAIKQDTGLTQLAIQIFRSVRRAILRGALVADAQAGGSVALDYLVFAQLRLELGRGEPRRLGIRQFDRVDQGPDEARDHITATHASEIWRQAMFELQRQSFVTNDDLVEAYLDYSAASPVLKRQAVAIVAGMAMERSLNASSYDVPLHDAIAADLALDDNEGVRTMWQPTAAMLQLLPKEEQLKIAEPFVEAASFGPWQRLKTAQVTPLVLAAVTGTSNVVRASLARAAATWVHPLLRFLPVEQSADADIEMAEAAE